MQEERNGPMYRMSRSRRPVRGRSLGEKLKPGLISAAALPAARKWLHKGRDVSDIEEELRSILALDQPARRKWLRGWMSRMGLENANQAAPMLCLARTTVERMIYDPPRSSITDQTMKIAWQAERLRLSDSA